MKLYLMISACLLLLAGCTANVTVDALDGGVRVVNSTGGYVNVTVNSESPVRLENGASYIKLFTKDDDAKLFVSQGLFLAAKTNDYVFTDGLTNTLTLTANRGAIRFIHGGATNWTVSNITVVNSTLSISNRYTFSTPLIRGNYVDFVLQPLTNWNMYINDLEMDTEAAPITVVLAAMTNVIVGGNPPDIAGSPVFLKIVQ